MTGYSCAHPLLAKNGGILVSNTHGFTASMQQFVCEIRTCLENTSRWLIEDHLPSIRWWKVMANQLPNTMDSSQKNANCQGEILNLQWRLFPSTNHVVSGSANFDARVAGMTSFLPSWDLCCPLGRWRCRWSCFLTGHSSSKRCQVKGDSAKQMVEESVLKL